MKKFNEFVNEGLFKKDELDKYKEKFENDVTDYLRGHYMKPAEGRKSDNWENLIALVKFIASWTGLNNVPFKEDVYEVTDERIHNLKRIEVKKNGMNAHTRLMIEPKNEGIDVYTNDKGKTFKFDEQLKMCKYIQKMIEFELYK
jgi:hypothetical protein